MIIYGYFNSLNIFFAIASCGAPPMSKRGDAIPLQFRRTGFSALILRLTSLTFLVCQGMTKQRYLKKIPLHFAPLANRS